jgi:hypothetical protein
MLRLLAVTGLVLCTVVAPAQPPRSGSKGTKIVGGTFDPSLQERAPEGGLLVGLEISLTKFVDRDVIRSLRPIYRTSTGEEVKGRQYGTPQGKVYLAKAKPGYALGGVKLRTGLLIDGLSITFMKTRGATLDRNDAYETVWIGNEIGGSPGTLAGDGTPIVGFAGKTTANNKECSRMGLILK